MMINTATKPNLRLKPYQKSSTFDKNDLDVMMPQLSVDETDDSTDTRRFRSPGGGNRRSPLRIKVLNEKPSTNPCKLLNKMKNKVKKEKGYKSSKSPIDYKLSYIFASPSTTKSDLEERVSEFLSREGIFQIHLDIVLKELGF